VEDLSYLWDTGTQMSRDNDPAYFVDEHYPENRFYLHNTKITVGPRWNFCPWCRKRIDGWDTLRYVCFPFLIAESFFQSSVLM
jgi:hypothetical protein